MSLQKVICEILVGDGRLGALCQTASCDGARNMLFIIMNVGEKRKDLTDGAANKNNKAKLHDWRVFEINH